MSDKPQSKNLVQKLCEVVEAVERIPKNGWNNYDNYQYVMEVDLVQAIRLELAKRHIMILPSMKKVERAQHLNDKGKTKYLTSVEVEYTIEDGESGETRKVIFGGDGQDAGDKGIYKAFTGSQKYMLQKTFMIPTGDDPERDHEKHDDKPQEGHGFPKQDQGLPNPPANTKRAEKAQERAEGRQLLKGKLSGYSFLNGFYSAFIDGTRLWTKDKPLGVALQTMDKSDVIAQCGMGSLGKTGKLQCQVFGLMPASMTDDLNMDAPSDVHSDIYEPGEDG